jgi:hypothetical protein
MARDNIDYSHGDSGTEPPSDHDFQHNQRPDAQNFDWFWSTVINRINGIISEFNRLDSNDDGKVDAADQADNADTLDGEHADAFADVGHDHPKSYINGYQSNPLSDVDGGKLANCWETIEVNSGEFTIVDNKTIEVNEAGVYSIGYACDFHQKSGNDRAIMTARVLINGAGNFPHTGSRCYVRSTYSEGNRSSVSKHSMHSLNAGDTIEVRVNKEGGISGHDLSEASCVVQKIA